MKDFRSKAPFSKNANPFVKPVVVQTSFALASAGLYTVSIGTGKTTYSPTSVPKVVSVSTSAKTQVGPSRQGPKAGQIHPSRQLAGTDLQSSKLSQPPPATIRTHLTQVAPNVLSRKPVQLAPPAVSFSAPCSSFMSSSRTSSSARGQASAKPANFSASLPPTHYDQNYPPGESSAGPKVFASSKIMEEPPAAFPSASYEMMSTDSSSPMDVISTPKASIHSDPRPVSEHSTEASSHPRIQMSNSSQATPPLVPQTAGVKRRLGMGRTMTGYSNKKFKPPT